MLVITLGFSRTQPNVWGTTTPQILNPEGVTNKLEAWEIKVYAPLTYKKISTY
jgi:hypothetical protein